MYVCVDCGRLFDDPKSYSESHGLDSPPYEEYSGCPRCAGTYVQTFECDCCGEWITGKYVKLDDGTVACENCYMIKNIEDMEW